MAAEIIVQLVAAYLAVGLLVALPFVARGVVRVDPAATGASWRFRLLILPAATALWPVVASWWLRSWRGGDHS
ncbi:MAG: hypothetical protein HUU22_10730 [Phycisphaerae bacterium]|nr:hypothetical protein [Phycisphaerae bacterium]NUQ46496.1 hypothetical protein [Phycisphaerae bacterium]